MPTLYITEFSGIQPDPYSGSVVAAAVPSVADQTVAIGASSTQSAVLNAATRLIRVVSDVNCFTKIGVNPTASAETLRLVADSPEYFAVPAKSDYKIAVISET